MDCKKSIIKAFNSRISLRLTFCFIPVFIYFGILFSIEVRLYRRDIPFQPEETTGVIPAEHVGSKCTSEMSRKVYIGHTVYLDQVGFHAEHGESIFKAAVQGRFFSPGV